MSRTSHPASFSAWFLKENVFFVKFINWPNSIAWFPLLLEILGNMCIVNICCPVFDVINFEINFSSLIKLFLYLTYKNVNISRKKELYTRNKKTFFFIILIGLSIVRNCPRPGNEPFIFHYKSFPLVSAQCVYFSQKLFVVFVIKCGSTELTLIFSIEPLRVFWGLHLKEIQASRFLELFNDCLSLGNTSLIL